MEGFEVKAACGEYLDRLAELQAATRISYGGDKSFKPADNCYWDSDLGLWMENDSSFRARISAEIRNGRS